VSATQTPLTQNISADRVPLDLPQYEARAGYQALRKALEMGPAAVRQAVTDSGLRGRGGAGFPTGAKWNMVPMGPEARHPKYLVINADEMEPGTMKDRLLLEGDPHSFLESAIISAYAIEAQEAVIFLRWGYTLAGERVSRALEEVRAAGYLGPDILGSGYELDIWLHPSAGRYMCGEETGLLDALEGRRANPRTKPPFAVTVGLWGKPTVIQNVETICNVRHVALNGAEWFRGLSATGEGGTKLYGASGKVRRPGVWELPLGVTLREVLETHAGGMDYGLELRGVLPGGASTDFLTPEHLDVPLDFEGPARAGSRLGTGTLIVLDDRTCPVGMVLSLERFFARESCGFCTPCREGLPWVVRTLEALEAGTGVPGDLEILEHHVHGLGPGHTFCALAPGAMAPLGSALKYFRADFERHITEARCPWR
jgi:NADH-quinone oxidoreductase subunit F